MDAGIATILNATSPIFAFLLTVLVTRHETVTARRLLGVTAGLAGTAFIVEFEALQGLGQDVWAQLAIVAATSATRAPPSSADPSGGSIR